MHENQRVETAALLLLAVTVAAVVLYPENFIPGDMGLRGSLGLTSLSVLLPFLALGTLICLLLRFRALRFSWIDLVILAFLTFLVARNATSMPAASIKIAVFAACPYFLGALITRRGKPYTSIMLWFITALIALTVVYGLIEYAAQENLIYRPYISGAVLEPAFGLHRIGSSLAHPVVYAAFLLQTIPFSMLALVLTKKKWARILAGTVSVAAGVALFLTYSKGSWLVATILAGGGLLLLLRRKHRHVLWLVLLISVGVAILTAFFWEEINLETSVRAEKSVSTRMGAWIAATSIIEDHWITGVGLRHGKVEMVKVYNPEFLEHPEFAPSVDNNYLYIFLEEGIVGIALWLAILALLIREGVRQIRDGNDKNKLWAFAALASILVFVLNSVTFDALFIYANEILFWIAAGFMRGISWQGTPVGPKPD